MLLFILRVNKISSIEVSFSNNDFMIHLVVSESSVFGFNLLSSSNNFLLKIIGNSKEFISSSFKNNISFIVSIPLSSNFL